MALRRKQPGTEPSLIALRRKQHCHHFDLRLPASRTVRSKFLLFGTWSVTPGLWHFVIAALALKLYSRIVVLNLLAASESPGKLIKTLLDPLPEFLIQEVWGELLISSQVMLIMLV